jgi:hypothetical protein
MKQKKLRQVIKNKSKEFNATLKKGFEMCEAGY